ncbi:MAG: hypothetical protein A3H68_03265 [Candidatus Taylorbacteria bacterium RIFCSPLOWO2_02_FULL_46_40]|uniref:Hydroxyacid dehydrogenase n=1 Tax=Candidatus Taylorbacteria bacterium RIFCSPLOWO2_02_FULL_46_40 TaxID=1802329 RepID=A0A1G2P177_9BACT|nr:MAG: hypothetical protein A3H68_03265 [Candidatus Taylorbacteria bacterium RIFCSPLOWO2_02_FULL_46_40]
MDIILFESHQYDSRALNLYRTLGDVYLISDLEKKPILKRKVFGVAGIIVIRNHIRADKSFVGQFPKLKIIACPTTGLNHIDLSYASERRIRVISLRGETVFLNKITSTAEHAFALILSLARHIPWAFDSVKGGCWLREGYIGNELNRKTLGIVGLGRLGKMVARYALAFGMRVVAFDPFVSMTIMKKIGTKKISRDALFGISDTVSLHLPLNENTAQSIGGREFSLMKKTAFLINTSRGEVIVRGDLYSALKSKTIGGAAIDVMDDEDSSGVHLKTDPLYLYAREHKNLIITPHIGGMSVESMAATEEFIAKKVVKLLK